MLFQSYVGRTAHNEPILWAGEAGISKSSMPVILAAPRVAVQSDVRGLASLQPSTGGISGDVAIIGTATVGNASIQYAGQRLGP